MHSLVHTVQKREFLTFFTQHVDFPLTRHTKRPPKQTNPPGLLFVGEVGVVCHKTHPNTPQTDQPPRAAVCWGSGCCLLQDTPKEPPNRPTPQGCCLFGKMCVDCYNYKTHPKFPPNRPTPQGCCLVGKWVLFVPASNMASRF